MLPHSTPHRVSAVLREAVNAAATHATHRSTLAGESKRPQPTRSLFALGLMPRTLHALCEADIRSVPQLCELTEHELLLIPGIGDRSIAAIRKALAGRSLLLCGESNDHV